MSKPYRNRPYRPLLMLVLLVLLLLATGCMTSPKVEVTIHDSDNNLILISAPATGDPTKTVSPQTTATLPLTP